METRGKGTGQLQEVGFSPIQSQIKDSHRQDTTASLTGTSLCTYAIEPPCTEPYARWCERTATQIMGSLLLDYFIFADFISADNQCKKDYQANSALVVLLEFNNIIRCTTDNLT